MQALQNIRIKHRWEAIDLENAQIKQAKGKQREFKPVTFSNGDTKKQLLARSRYLLYKAPNNWTQNQYHRAKILFEQYPDIKKAFNLVQGLSNIFNTANSIQSAYTKLVHWYKDVEQTGFRAFSTIANAITINYRSILNYFINRSTMPPRKLLTPRLKPLEVSSGCEKYRILSLQVNANFFLNTTIDLDPLVGVIVSLFSRSLTMEFIFFDLK